MPLNHYVTLGNSGLKVSPVALGTMTFGEDWGWGSSVADSGTILDHYLSRGGNFIDTANAYTKGHSEAIIGDHLGQYSSKRDRVVIATKFVNNMYTGDPNGGGSNRKAVVAACEQSLRRLKTSYIDLYWMHMWDATTPVEETMRALDDLVRDGKVRYIGFSDTPAWKCVEAQMLSRFRGWAPLVALQIEYSLLERTVEGDLIPMAREFGMGVTPWSPLKSGVLSGKYSRDKHGSHESSRGAWATSSLDDKAYDIIDELTKIAHEFDSSVSRVALAWLSHRPGVTSTIIGARTLKQLDDNLGGIDLPITKAQIDKLDELSKPKLNFPADFLGHGASFFQGGTTVNGRSAEPWPMTPKNDEERY